MLCNFIEIILLHGWSLVNLLGFCRIIFLNNTYGGLALTFTLYKKHTVCCFLSLSTVIIHQFHSCTKNLTLIPFIPTPSSPHFHPDFPHPSHSALIPIIPNLIPRIPTLIHHIPTLIAIITTLIPIIPTLVPHSPTLITAFPAFPP